VKRIIRKNCLVIVHYNQSLPNSIWNVALYLLSLMFKWEEFIETIDKLVMISLSIMSTTIALGSDSDLKGNTLMLERE
jgi:hypothetical protein